MGPLGLFPVLVAMIKLILIQIKTAETLGVTVVPDTIHIHGVVADKGTFIHASGRKRKEVTCSKGYYLHPNGTHCCLRCHKGTYVAQHCLNEDKATKCLLCPQGTYLPEDNYMDKCFRCQGCRSSFGQIPVSDCTSEKDTVCGCGNKQYRSNDNREFFCKDCSACLNGKIRKECTKSSDTICECLPAFFLRKGENNCTSCSSCNEGECKEHCRLVNSVTSPQNSSEITFILGSLVILFGAASVFLLIRKIRPSCQRKLNASSFLCSSSQQPTREPSSKAVDNDFFPESIQTEGLLPQKTASASLPVQHLPDCVRAAGETQIPDRPEVLYTVVDHVPVSRWKEFVRRLGLNENAIERTYTEHRHMREAQYDMLRQWRLQAGHGATVERISNVLNQMEMSGCSEAIQEILPKQP
ncbi:tumor necrosis factor receptor superfamily member 1A-like isoform X2 [Rhineura floridana]|uniref:tumor necrosis factor receptor superfamily member 1A-like isoform X2 n=1 Tax=Rhineura floridana TaxID=261503 RepID=UPI002AC80623|nr:tumor necrosis factor receptor superfamily member 1A-like isoform X2 [Rhineura floridana]